jgi:hypothetical protein
VSSFAIDYLAELQRRAYKEVGIDPISWLPPDDPRVAVIDHLENLPDSRFEELFEAFSRTVNSLDIDSNATRTSKLEQLKKALRRESMTQVNESFLEHLRRAGWGKDEIDTQGGLKDLTSNTPTPFENPFDYHLVAQATSGLQDTMRHNASYQDAIEKTDRVVFGTVPTGDVNAKVIKTPHADAYLALFNNGIFRFTYLLSKVLSQALDFSDDDNAFEIPSTPVNRLVVEGPFLSRRLRHLVGAYVISGHPGFSRPYTTGPGPSYVASRLAKCMVTFLVAHEYAHVIQGDLDHAKSVRSTILGNNVNQILFSQKSEYSADFIALDLMTRTKRAEKELSILIEWAPTLLLLGLHIVRNGFEVLQTGTEQPDPETKSHPTVPARLAAVLGPLYKSENSGLVQMRERADWLVALFGSLWQEMRTSFERGYELKVAPAAIWLDEKRARSRGQAVSVYTDTSRVGSVPCHKLRDGEQALTVGDYIWLMGDRHAAEASWRCALNLGQKTAARRLMRSESFDPAMNDEVVFS